MDNADLYEVTATITQLRGLELAREEAVAVERSLMRAALHDTGRVDHEHLIGGVPGSRSGDGRSRS